MENADGTATSVSHSAFSIPHSAFGKGPGAANAGGVRKDLPAHAISTKNKHLLVIYSIPTRGFTAVVSVFRGTPPPKPFRCKSRPDTFGVLGRDRGANPIGGEPRLSHA
jgi:hypothetical protein